MYKSEQHLFDNGWGPCVEPHSFRRRGHNFTDKEHCIDSGMSSFKSVCIRYHPEWKSCWTYVFIHIPLINLQEAMSSKDFYKQHRWPWESSVLPLTVERNWIAGERRALAGYINHAAPFQQPESIWTIQMLPESPNSSCYNSFCMFFFLSSVAMVILCGSTRLWKAVRSQAADGCLEDCKQRWQY